MTHRRKGRRLSLAPLTPEVRQTLLKLAGVPRHLLTRARRAQTPAALEALLDPRRHNPPARRMPRVACGKGAGKVG
jgi:hypothetical protein